MANPYYTRVQDFTPGTRVRSSEVDAELDAVVVGFDLLPSTATALTRGVNTFAGVSAGTGNAFTVSMPDTRLTNQDGDEVVFIADRSSTGAATLNVDGIGPVSVVRNDGSATSADDIKIGLIHAVRYDNANTRFQMISISFNHATDAATATANAGYAQEWANKAEDSLISAAAGGDQVDDYSAFHWAQKALAAAADVTRVQGTSVDLPSAPGTFTANLPWENVNGVELARLGFLSDADFWIDSDVHGGRIVLRSETTAGASANLFSGDPDGAALLYFNGDETLLTSSSGIEIRHPTTDSPQLKWGSSVGVAHLHLLAVAGGVYFDGMVNSQEVYIRSTNAAAAITNLLRGDPDGPTRLYHNSIERIRTETDGVNVTGGDVAVSDTTGNIAFRAWNTTNGGTAYRTVTTGNGEINQLSATGVVEKGWVNFNRDAGVWLLHNGNNALNTNVDGATVRSTTGAEVPTLQWQGVSALMAQIFATPGAMSIRSLTGEVRIDANTTQRVLTGAVGGATSLAYSGDDKLATQGDGVRIENGTSASNLQVTGADATVNEGGQITLDGSGTYNDNAIDNFQGQLRLFNVTLGEDYVVCVPNAAVSLNYNDVPRVITSTNGARVEGTSLRFAESSDATQTFSVYNEVVGGAALQNLITTADARLIGVDNTGAAGEVYVYMARNGAVTLYHDNNAKLATAGTGIDITGTRVDLDNSGFATPARFLVRNSEGGVDFSTDGGDLQISYTDSSGTQRAIAIDAAYTGAITLYHNNQDVLTTNANGINVIDGSTEVPAAYLVGAGGTTYGSAFAQSSGLTLRAVAAGGDVLLQPNNGDSGVLVESGGAVTLYHNNVAALATLTNGVAITNSATGINTNLFFREGVTDRVTQFYDVTAHEFNIRTEETNSDIALRVRNETGTAYDGAVVARSGGTVELYHSGDKKFETLSTGVTVTGNVATTGSIFLTDTGSPHIIFESNALSTAVSSITRNDGGGNWNFRASNYYNSGAGEHQYTVTNDGAVQMYMTHDAANGQFIVRTAVTGTAGTAITWANTTTMNTVSTTFTNAINANGGINVSGTDVVLESRTLTGGTGIATIGDLSANRTITLDLDELSTSTTDGDGDFFVVVDSVGAQRKLTKANINLTGFNNDLSFGVRKMKTANEVVSNATMQDDDHWTGWSLVADKWYRIEVVFTGIGTSSTTDCDFQFVFTNTPQDGHGGWITYDQNNMVQMVDITSESRLDGTDTDSTFRFDGLFQANATTGGTLKVQWAAASTGSWTIYEGSWMLVEQLD